MFLFHEKNQAWFCGKEGMREALATVASCSSWFCSVTTQLDSSVSYDTKLCTTKRPSLLSTAVHLDNHRINVLTVLLPWLWTACTEGPTHAISVARLPLHCPSLHVLGVELSPEPAEHCPWQQPAPKSWGKNSVMPMCLLLTSIRGKSRKSRSAFQLPSCSKLCQTFGPIFSLPSHWENNWRGSWVSSSSGWLGIVRSHLTHSLNGVFFVGLARLHTCTYVHTSTQIKNTPSPHQHFNHSPPCEPGFGCAVGGLSRASQRHGALCCNLSTETVFWNNNKKKNTQEYKY